MRSVPALTPALTAALFVLAGCGQAPVRPDAAAVLVAPSSAVRAELRAALTAALGTAPVALAEDALTLTNVLIVDRARPREPALAGRTVEASVQRFELVLTDGRCVLTRPADGGRWPLAEAVCVAQ